MGEAGPAGDLGARRRPPARPAGVPDDGRDLDGLAAVVFAKLRSRPAWASGSSPWISTREARRVAEADGTTLEIVEAALAAARERRGRLTNPAGFVLSRIREPDFLEIEAERDRRRRRADAERLEAEKRARAEAERAEVYRAADEAERRRAAIVATLGAGELEAIVEDWLANEAAPIRRHALALRTPAERVASALRFGEIDHRLEGVGA